MEKPPRVFDRDAEWARLGAFVARRTGRPEFAVVSGRRRQGKTFLLEAMARAADGMYFGATEATSEESLRLLGESLAGVSGHALPLRFVSWDEAVGHLVETSARIPGPVVVDEFPYLVRAAPSIPSVLQRELDRAVTEGREVSLVVCGSSMSVMGGLLAGTAPLRGRATMELVIRPFDHRTARQYWAITDPGLAARVHAVVGGTPAYRRFIGDDTPSDPADFDAWVIRAVLDPASPLFREARYLLAEEAGVRDTPMYSSILAAVADGNATRGGIASYIGRKAADIGHHLAVLEDAGLVRREPDAFRAGRSSYHVAEPIVAFYHSVMRPRWALLESGRAEQVWRDAAPRFAAQVLGPHFEHLCREWVMTGDHVGGLPGEVTAGVVNDPANRTQIDVDVVVLAPASTREPRRILALGEAKWGETMGAAHVERLRRARDLLALRGYDTRDTRLVCFGAAGFHRDLADQVAGGRVMTVDLETIYG